MKSKANLATHPIHPMLVVFPLGLLIGALIFDVLAILSENNSFWQTGKHLTAAGVIGGFMAAIPGIIDYKHTVPPKSSAKSRALKHGIVNTLALVLFILSYIIRVELIETALEDSSVYGVLGLEIAGAGLLTIGGWMGGTLAYRNQIGVDHRYANAGKWNETHIEPKPGEILAIASTNEIETDQMKLVHLGEKRIVVAKTEEGYVAFDDRCTHKGASMAGGSMMCGTVQCPWHGSQFDVNNGKVKAGPAKEPIKTYKIEVRNGNILLNMDTVIGKK
ncbi:MAG: DUF2231 domain-containing protein [Cytophagaceae bacterium]